MARERHRWSGPGKLLPRIAGRLDSSCTGIRLRFVPLLSSAALMLPAALKQGVVLVCLQVWHLSRPVLPSSPRLSSSGYFSAWRPCSSLMILGKGWAGEWEANIAVPAAGAYGGPVWRLAAVRRSTPGSHQVSTAQVSTVQCRSI